MKKLLLLSLIIIGCSGKTSLNDADKEYVRTTLDLLKTRSNFSVQEDSNAVKRSLDSVYKRHHTSAGEYKKETESFSTDRDRTAAIFSAINDSIGK